MTRYRDLGLTLGQLPTGPNNAITDIAGVRVGTVTLIEGEGPLVVGQGPIRTGVTVIVPHDTIGDSPLFAGCHTLNGNGEMTGLEWVREAGQLTTPIAITNTHSVGIVRDALVAADMATRSASASFWSLPVVAETYDGGLNDINGMHVTAAHLHQALAVAAAGPVPEGNVGGGTGMVCHEFKGGTGTASRIVNGWRVGALVQANYGDRDHLTIDGVPVGRELSRTVIPSAWDDEEAIARRGAGSIIVILATDAPILPHQLTRLAQRAGLGIARMGGSGAHSSGDIFLAFSTANVGALPQLQGGRVERGVLGDDAARRRDVGPVLGRDRVDRGGDLQRADRGADDGRTGWGHGARAPPRRAHRRDDAVRARTPRRRGDLS